MSFLTPPPPVSESEIIRTEYARVVVVGEGLSGLCCALSAQENGADTLIVTASRGPVGRGGSVFAAYSKVMEEHGIPRPDLDRFYLQELEGVSFLADQRKWYDMFNHSEEAMNWLTDILRKDGLDVVLEDGNEGDHDSPTYQPPCTHAFVGKGVTRAGVGITLAVKALEDSFMRAGGRVIHSAPARQLEKKNGRVTGLIAETSEGFIRINASQAVVLATGDFSANQEMMRAYCPQYAENFTADGTDYDIGFNTGGGLYRGEGHQMALWAGAAWQRTWPAAPMIQGSRLGSNLPYGSHRGLRVNIRGERYCNEDMNGAYTALTTLREPKGRAFAIWGTNYARDIRWRAHGGQRDGPDNPPENVIRNWETQVEQGKLFKADTLPELIDMLGLPASTLDTVEHYNSLCRAGKDTDFHKSPMYLQEILEPPFYGGELNDIRFFTVLGGPRTDSEMRICDADDNPIPGLYCVGSMVGDMYANYYNFRIPGQNYGACLSLGYLTGRRLASK